MNSFANVSVVLLVSTAIFSCGVLESNPLTGAAPAQIPDDLSTPLPDPAVTPEVTPGGQYANTTTTATNADSVSKGNSTAGGLTSGQTASSDSLNSVAAGKPIFQTDRCNRLSRGGFIWFTNQVVLDDWLSPLESAEASQVRSKIDFSKQGALLLDYGIAGSKGSGATVLGELKVNGQDGVIKIKQFKAPANKKSPQVVTHPCSLFVMPRTGFSTLVVLSEQGDKLTSFDNK